MKNIDRMSFPRKYPLSDVAKILALAGIVLGLLLHNHTQNKLEKTVLIRHATVAAATEQYIEISYEVENRSGRDQKVDLFLKVYDNQKREIASELFNIEVSAGRRELRSKLLDELIRPLHKGEKPDSVSLIVYKKKVL